MGNYTENGGNRISVKQHGDVSVSVWTPTHMHAHARPIIGTQTKRALAAEHADQ